MCMAKRLQKVSSTSVSAKSSEPPVTTASLQPLAWLLSMYRWDQSAKATIAPRDCVRNFSQWIPQSLWQKCGKFCSKSSISSWKHASNRHVSSSKKRKQVNTPGHCTLLGSNISPHPSRHFWVDDFLLLSGGIWTKFQVSGPTSASGSSSEIRFNQPSKTSPFFPSRSLALILSLKNCTK